VDKAALHLERALQLDPLLITAATALEEVYRKQGTPQKAVALAAERIERDPSNTKPLGARHKSGSQAARRPSQ
jgi:hypothetical protein